MDYVGFMSNMSGPTEIKVACVAELKKALSDIISDLNFVYRYILAS